VLYYGTLGQAVPEALKLDVYRPVGDTETSRPLVILFHTGNFLPFPLNQGCGGHKRDSSLVEVANRLAKMGYVTASADYRLGWNPIASTDVLRRQGIINAAYRGVQDARNAVRFFKESVFQGNQYGIDTNKIVLWGHGTGGYITLNAAALDKYSEIPLAPGGKFFWDHDNNAGTPVIPMVVESLNGNINGTSLGILQNPMTGAAIDTFNIPNYVNHDSDFALAVNLAGALGDSTWIDGNEPPIISFHVPNDNFAPYDRGVVNVPNTPLQVIEVVGSYYVQHELEKYGVNDVFAAVSPQLALYAEQQEAFANSPILQPGNIDVSDPTAGLYPFVMPPSPTDPNLPLTTSPWDWTAYMPTAPATCQNSKAAALPYIDTTIAFYAPRACFALGLEDCITQIVAAGEPLTIQTDLKVFPNPSNGPVLFTNSQPILGMEIYNAEARLVRTENSINQTQYTLQRNGMPKGIYVAKLYFKEGVQAVRFILE
jgi:hypothetical protein